MAVVDFHARLNETIQQWIEEKSLELFQTGRAAVIRRRFGFIVVGIVSEQNSANLYGPDIHVYIENSSTL